MFQYSLYVDIWSAKFLIFTNCGYRSASKKPKRATWPQYCYDTTNSKSKSKFYNLNPFEINTPTGNYVIQKGHAPAIMPLSPAQGLTFRLKTGKQETLTVRNGIVKINRESATVIMTVMES